MPAGKVEMVSDEIARFDAAMNLSDLYAQLKGNALLVEPLSAKQSIADFVAQGGIGYGSASEGTFGASICRIRTDSINFGSDSQVLYNVGYPLHRMAEGSGSALTEALGTAQELTVYVRKPEEPVGVFEATEEFPAQAPADASDFLVLNAAAAKLMGLESAGTVAFYPRELAPSDGNAVKALWAKRFIEDALPAHSHTAKILTQTSAAKATCEVAKESDVIFAALFVYTGVLVLLSGKETAVKPIENQLLAAPLSWKLGAAVEVAADEPHGH